VSVEVTTAMKQSYKDNVTMLCQQKESKLSGCVRIEQQAGEFDYYDQIGATNAVQKKGRHTDTPLISTPHDRRQVTITDYEWADLIDKEDKLRGIGELTSPYAQNAGMALNRTKDSVIISAFFGDSRAGKDGSRVVAFPTATNSIAANFVLSGTAANSGLTVQKLIKARAMLLAKQVDLDAEEAYIAITSTQLTDLLNTTQTTSSDYNNVKALVEGKIDKFMGFTFKHSELLQFDSSGNQRVPVWVKSGILLAMSKDVSTEIDRLPGKSYATQVYASMSLGATRMEEAKVLEIKCAVA
jgi:hypothetical protein